MNLLKKWGIPFVWGMAYCALVLLFSQVLLRNLHVLISWLNANALAQVTQKTQAITETVFTSAVSQDTMAQIIRAVKQLSSASICSPWLVTLPIGGGLGLLFRVLFPKKKVRLWVSIVAGTLFLLPLMAIALCFTEVNTIRMLDLVKAVVPLFS